jgi:hypothetical protein
MNDIAELMARDPLQLTKENIDAIIAEMRKSRHQFNAGNMTAGSTKPKTEKQKQVLALADKLKISL